MNRKNIARLGRFALIVVIALQAVGCASTGSTGGTSKRKSLPEMRNEVENARHRVNEGIQTVKGIGDTIENIGGIFN